MASIFCYRHGPCCRRRPGPPRAGRCRAPTLAGCGGHGAPSRYDCTRTFFLAFASNSLDRSLTMAATGGETRRRSTRTLLTKRAHTPGRSHVARRGAPRPRGGRNGQRLAPAPGAWLNRPKSSLAFCWHARSAPGVFRGAGGCAARISATPPARCQCPYIHTRKIRGRTREKFCAASRTGPAAISTALRRRARAPIWTGTAR